VYIVLLKFISVDLHRNKSVPSEESIRRRPTRAISAASPELFILFDYANTRTFSGSNNAIVEYLSILLHAINNRYRTINDPQIQFKISGLTAIQV